MKGLIRSYNDRRGFGFIDPLIGKPGEAEAVFFHVTALRNGATPVIGCEVSFDLVRGRKGPQAANVELVLLKKPGTLCAAPARPA